MFGCTAPLLYTHNFVTTSTWISNKVSILCHYILSAPSHSTHSNKCLATSLNITAQNFPRRVLEDEFPVLGMLLHTHKQFLALSPTLLYYLFCRYVHFVYNNMLTICDYANGVFESQWYHPSIRLTNKYFLVYWRSIIILIFTSIIKKIHNQKFGFSLILVIRLVSAANQFLCRLQFYNFKKATLKIWYLH